jgi:hypothetical protein
MDCNEYDKVLPSSITPTQYRSINPTTTGSSAANDVVKDPSGNPVVYTADTQITFYISSTTAPIYLPASQFPTVRQLWTCGTETTPGWNGIKYRYGQDALVNNVISSVCVPGNTWTFFNYGSKKRSDDTPKEQGEIEAEKLYQNITETFMYWTEERNMTPQEALDRMAYDNCMANPNVWTEESKKILRGIGLTPSSTKRICDKDEDLKDDEDDMDHFGMDMSNM